LLLQVTVSMKCGGATQIYQARMWATSKKKRIQKHCVRLWLTDA